MGGVVARHLHDPRIMNDDRVHDLVVRYLRDGRV
jgi:hypothetical protein